MTFKQRLFTLLLGLLFATVLTDQASALYDPGVGRFCSRDPIGYSDGLGLQTVYFVPFGTDPSGEKFTDPHSPTTKSECLDWYNESVRECYTIPWYRIWERHECIQAKRDAYVGCVKRATDIPPPGTGRPNVPTTLGFQALCPSLCKSKANRLKGKAGTLPAGTNPDMGPIGGHNSTYPFPAVPPKPLGGGGSETCIIVVIKCPSSVTVFHLTTLNNAPATLNQWAFNDCRAMVCGGNDEGDSNCLADETISALEANSIPIDVVSGASSCGVDENGDWFEK